MTQYFSDFFNLAHKQAFQPSLYNTSQLQDVAPAVMDRVTTPICNAITQVASLDPVLQVSLLDPLLNRAKQVLHSLPWQPYGNFAHAMGATLYYYYSSHAGLTYFLSNAKKVNQARSITEKPISCLLFLTANLIRVNFELWKRCQVQVQQLEYHSVHGWSDQQHEHDFIEQGEITCPRTTATNTLANSCNSSKKGSVAGDSYSFLRGNLASWLAQQKSRGNYNISITWTNKATWNSEQLELYFEHFVETLVPPAVSSSLTAIFPDWQQQLKRIILGHDKLSHLYNSLIYGQQTAYTMAQQQLQTDQLAQEQQQLRRKHLLQEQVVAQQLQLLPLNSLQDALQQFIGYWQLKPQLLYNFSKLRGDYPYYQVTQDEVQELTNPTPHARLALHQHQPNLIHGQLLELMHQQTRAWLIEQQVGALHQTQQQQAIINKLQSLQHYLSSSNSYSRTTAETNPNQPVTTSSIQAINDNITQTVQDSFLKDSFGNDTFTQDTFTQDTFIKEAFNNCTTTSNNLSGNNPNRNNSNHNAKMLADLLGNLEQWQQVIAVDQADGNADNSDDNQEPMVRHGANDNYVANGYIATKVNAQVNSYLNITDDLVQVHASNKQQWQKLLTATALQQQQVNSELKQVQQMLDNLGFDGDGDRGGDRDGDETRDRDGCGAGYKNGKVDGCDDVVRPKVRDGDGDGDGDGVGNGEGDGEVKGKGLSDLNPRPQIDNQTLLQAEQSRDTDTNPALQQHDHKANCTSLQQQQNLQQVISQLHFNLSNNLMLLTTKVASASNSFNLQQRRLRNLQRFLAKKPTHQADADFNNIYKSNKASFIGSLVSELVVTNPMYACDHHHGNGNNNNGVNRNADRNSGSFSQGVNASDNYIASHNNLPNSLIAPLALRVSNLVQPPRSLLAKVRQKLLRNLPPKDPHRLQHSHSNSSGLLSDSNNSSTEITSKNLLSSLLEQAPTSLKPSHWQDFLTPRVQLQQLFQEQAKQQGSELQQLVATFNCFVKYNRQQSNSLAHKYLQLQQLNKQLAQLATQLDTALQQGLDVEAQLHQQQQQLQLSTQALNAQEQLVQQLQTQLAKEQQQLLDQSTASEQALELQAQLHQQQLRQLQQQQEATQQELTNENNQLQQQLNAKQQRIDRLQQDLVTAVQAVVSYHQQLEQQQQDIAYYKQLIANETSLLNDTYAQLTDLQNEVAERNQLIKQLMQQQQETKS